MLTSSGDIHGTKAMESTLLREKLSRFPDSTSARVHGLHIPSTRSPRDKCWHRYIAPRVMTRLFSTSMCSKTNVPIDAAMHRIVLCGSLVLLTACSVSAEFFCRFPAICDGLAFVLFCFSCTRINVLVLTYNISRHAS